MLRLQQSLALTQQCSNRWEISPCLALKTTPTPPSLILCRHCAIFQTDKSKAHWHSEDFVWLFSQTQITSISRHFNKEQLFTVHELILICLGRLLHCALKTLMLNVNSKWWQWVKLLCVTITLPQKLKSEPCFFPVIPLIYVNSPRAQEHLT